MNGFTLIEMMIVAVIMAILTAIAVSSYLENVRKSRRAEVRGVLLENAQFLERYFTENNRYDQNLAGTAVVLPWLSSPKAANPSQYTISFVAGSPTAAGYTIQAVPVAGKAMAGDKCGSYILNNIGQQTNANLVAPQTSADCWAR
ncbi:type IV pilin protein [Undibacterium sp. Xuan67W]